VEIKSYEDFECESTFTNELLGALTTSYGRLCLFDIIHKVGDSALYYDTDSIVYHTKRSSNEPYAPLKTGTLLGQLTDELDNPETYIQTFCSSGPKCYAYRTNTGDTTLKLKGISLNYTNRQVFDFDAIKRVVLGTESNIKTPFATQITRQKCTGVIYNRPYIKTYNKVFTKRRIIRGSYTTYPYGYRM
jgi:hypothetical protein